MILVSLLQLRKFASRAILWSPSRTLQVSEKWVVLNSFHLNGHALEFYAQTQNIRATLTCTA